MGPYVEGGVLPNFTPLPVQVLTSIGPKPLFQTSEASSQARFLLFPTGPKYAKMAMSRVFVPSTEPAGKCRVHGHVGLQWGSPLKGISLGLLPKTRSFVVRERNANLDSV